MKAKGVCVKEFPKHWYKYQKISEFDDVETKKKKLLFNSILIEKKPYFFTYLYKHVKDDYKNYVNGRNEYCRVMFGMTIDELYLKANKTDKEMEFLSKYEAFLPVIDTNCEMNMICRRMEEFHKSIKDKISTECNDLCYTNYVSSVDLEEDMYNKIKSEVQKYFKDSEEFKLMGMEYSKNKYNEEEEIKIDNIYSLFKSNMNIVCSNPEILVNYLVPIFYNDLKSKNKDILWKCYGKYMFRNVESKVNSFLIPCISKHGSIRYLGKRFASREVYVK